MNEDTRTDAGQFYPGGKVISTRPVATGGDVKHSDFANVEPLPERFTDEDVRMRFNQLVSAAKGASAAIAALLLCATTYGAGVTVQTAPKGAIYNDEPVVTNVNFDATGLAAASNVYTKAETEEKIVELAPAPGNYAAVSNAAMNALQNAGEQTISSGRLDVWGVRPDLDPLLRAGNSADSHWVGLSREHICRRKYDRYYDYYLQDTSGTLAFTADITNIVPAWARAAQKPTYTASEISVDYVWGETVQQFASNIDSFLGSLPSPSDMLIKMYDGRVATYSGGLYYPVEELYIGDSRAATVADIPDVPAWALEAQKPTYTAAEVGATSPAAVSNIVSTVYVREKLGAWMEYDETTGLYYYCHEEE